MQRGNLSPILVVLALTVSYAQEQPKSETNAADSASVAAGARTDDARSRQEATFPVVEPARSQGDSEGLGVGGKFRYYFGETYANPSFLTAPAFRAAIRMSNPPGHFPTTYPADWRQGLEGFGRNYGDAIAQRVSFHTARFLSGALIREDPRYFPSSSRNALLRSLRAFGYTFIDRSDSGRRMPAFSNFIGAAAAGFVGNAYLPPGFANGTHAGQRSALEVGFLSAGNLYREFAPQMPRPLRMFIEMIGR